ncbi:TonB-dependent receptor [Rhodoferax sp.]|uniref:TonB-dependent receptor n=1 Tax=Rhodoferax sp. TaxID=50421 RepID=UPI002721F8EF|nr:TonB-dependent receptor [Rhodoferax sp.]MDO9196597.1 TonB-dependent receptor [Rhodoferax sp.]
MKTSLSCARLAVLPLALAAAFPSFAQTQLKDVVVTATRFAEPAASLPFGVSVISADEIQASGVNSVNEAVMKLLGVPGRLDTSGGNNYTLDLRGFGVTANSNQLVIVDGLRLNEADLSSAGLASIPIESVEKIEVLRGTGAVLYGEGATGGVIVVTTKAATAAQRVNSARLYGAAGSNGLQDLRASAVLASGGFSMDVSADDRRSDGHRQNFASSSDSLAATGQWSNAWLRLGARAGRNSMESGLPGALSAAAYAADPYQADPSRASSRTDHVSTKKENAGVFFEATLGSWQLAGDANQRSKELVSVNYASPYSYNVDASNYSLRARHEGKFGADANVFVIGYDDGAWDRTITQSTFTPVGTLATARSSAYYLKDDLTFASSGTRLSVGWRSEGMKKKEASSVTALDERQNAWDVGVSQPVMKDVTVYGRVGSSFRLANVDEFSFSTPGVPLKAQTSRDFELGARWKLAAGGVDVRWYRHDLTNEIGYDPAGVGPFGPFGANINFDPTQRQGLELEVKQALSPSLDVRLNAALRQATFTAGAYAGKDMALVPGQTIGARANWRPAPGHTLDGGVNWVAEQSPDFANACKMPSYATVDLRYAYQYRNAEFAVGVANLTDEKYYTQAYGCTAGVTTAIYPEPGRTVTASVRVKF